MAPLTGRCQHEAMNATDAPVIRRVLTWIGDVGARVASRFRALPARARALVAGGAALALVAGVAIPALVFANVPAPTAAPSAPASAPTSAPVVQASGHDDPAAGAPCQSLLDPAMVSAALDSSTFTTVAKGDLGLAIVGGFDCRYIFGVEDFSVADGKGYIDITVAPAHITSADTLQVSLKSAECFESTLGTYLSECQSLVAVGDWWYSLSVGNRASRDELRASFTTVTNELEEALAAAPEAPPAVVVQPFDCAAAGISMPLLETRRERFGGRYGDNELRLAASLLAAPVTCIFGEPEGDSWTFTVYPGGASAYESCASGPGVSIVVPGTTAAFAASIPWHPELCATDGTSLVVAKGSSPDGTGWAELGANDPALDVLTTLLVPIFEAIVPSAAPYVAQPTVASAPTSVAPLLDGDCSALLAPTALGAFVDEDHYTEVRKSAPDFEAVGGIQCSYLFLTDAENSGYFPYLAVHVDAAPSTIADPAVVRASLSDVACSVWIEQSGVVHSRCNAIANVHGWWYEVQVFALMSEAELRADFATITSMVKNSLTAAAPPARVKAIQPFDCGAAAGDMSWSSQRDISGGSSAIAVAAALLAAPTACEYVQSDERWRVTVYPGRPEAFDACTGGRMPGELLAAPIAVAGVTSVVPIGGSGDRVLCATDGASGVRASRYFFGQVPEISDEQYRADLSRLLVRIFAAAK